MTSSYIREGYGSFRFHEGGRCFSRGDYTFLASLVFGHVLQSKKTKRMRCGSPGLHNMRPAEAFLAARESSVVENVAKARPQVIVVPEFLAFYNELKWNFATCGKFMLITWFFELSELCRPAVTRLDVK